MQINKQAIEIHRSRIKNRQANRWGNNKMDEMLSFDSCYVRVSVDSTDPDKFCTIVDCNDSFLCFFGYEEKKDVLNMDI